MENRGPVVASYCATFLKPEMLHIYRQLGALRRYRSVVFTPKRENAEQFPWDDVVPVRRSRVRWLRRLWYRKLKNAPVILTGGEAVRLASQLRAREAGVLHVYFGHVAVQLMPLLERWTPMPSVVSFHGADGMVELDRPAFRAATLEMLGRVTLVLARSKSLIDALLALGCPAGKLRLQRTGIPLGQYLYQRRPYPQDGKWRLLQAGRLIEKKGYATTLRAFAEFAREYPQASLTIAGEGPLEPALRHLACEIGVASKVEFAGFLAPRDLGRLLYEAHLFLHPSEIGADGNQEGVPNSMLEAMATGLPVFATTHGGIPEAIEHGIDGWLVPERDHEALGRGLLELAADPARLAAMGSAASASVAANFEQSAQARRLEGYYDEAIALAGGGACR